MVNAWQRVLGRTESVGLTACQRQRFEECPPAVRERGPEEGELDRSNHVYLRVIGLDDNTRFLISLNSV